MSGDSMGEYGSSQVTKSLLLWGLLSFRLRHHSIFLIPWQMPLAIFEPLGAPNHWQPSALAAGPFAGLQGGAVASLLTAEVEAIAAERKWGTAVSRDGVVPAADADGKIANAACRSDRGRPRQRDRQHAVARRRGAALRDRAGDAVARTRGRGARDLPTQRATPSTRHGFRCAPGRPPMAGPGSWTPWRRAPAMTSPGFASTIRSSRAPGRCRRCSVRRTGPMASRGHCRMSWRIPIRT